MREKIGKDDLLGEPAKNSRSSVKFCAEFGSFVGENVVGVNVVGRWCERPESSRRCECCRCEGRWCEGHFSIVKFPN
jgi:hypothetical protein